MIKLRKIFHSGEKGFTLIELLVVISILGALAAVVVLNVGQFMGRGCDQAADTEKHNVQTAIVAYMVDHSNLPPGTMTDLTTASGGLPPLLLSAPHGTYGWDASTGQVTSQTYSPCR